MKKYKILFLCVHNSARSQMAEAFLIEYGQEYFEPESAGLEPGKLNPNVVEVMKEICIDISNNSTKDVFELFQQGKKFDAVITMCDTANAERCPVFPGKVKRIAWYFADPSQFTGTKEEILEKIRQVRTQIQEKVEEFITAAKKLDFWI